MAAVDDHTELPPPAYNAAPGHSPSFGEMLSPNPAHASPVSPQSTGFSEQESGHLPVQPETTGFSQQESGHLPAQPSSAYIAPPLQEPMGALPVQPHPSSPQTVGGAGQTNGVHGAGQPEIQEATRHFDGEISKGELPPDLEAHPAMNAKYLSEGQEQVHGGQQPQPHAQNQNIQYPGTNGANGVYQNAVPLQDLGRVPAPVDCPRCERRGLTDCEMKNGGFTNMLALVLCCCFCLGCVPYCINGTKDILHKCSSCQTLLAVWHRSNSKAVVVAFK